MSTRLDTPWVPVYDAVVAAQEGLRQRETDRLILLAEVGELFYGAILKDRIMPRLPRSGPLTFSLGAVPSLDKAHAEQRYYARQGGLVVNRLHVCLELIDLVHQAVPDLDVRLEYSPASPGKIEVKVTFTV